MKFNKLLILGLAFAVSFSSCKDDDESTPAQSLENAKLSFSASDTPIELPQALVSSTDTYAQQVVSYVTSINGMTTQLSQFDQIPSGATKSTTPIGRKSKSGRIEGDYIVYTWSDGQGYTAAYQISETTSTYVWEFFVQYSPDTEFIKVLRAEESKLVRMGSLEVYDFSGSSQSTEYQLKYSWNEDPDGTLYFDFYYLDIYKINAVINPDNSGSISYYDGVDLIYVLTWDATGAGTWAYYDSTGSVADSGTWG